MKREREEELVGRIELHELNTQTPAEIRARFKIKAQRKIVKLVQETKLSESDYSTLVLCSMQTLLSPVQQVATGREGQVPCEGYFIVVKTTEPNVPIYEKGFIFFPPSGTYRSTKQAVNNLKDRIAQSHCIDPSLHLHAGQQWSRALTMANDVSMKICKSVDDLAGVMDAVMTAADSLRESKVSTSVFVTESGSRGSVELALQWMKNQSRMKLSSVCVQTPEMIFGEDWCSEDIIGKDAPRVGGSEFDRCVAHPQTSLNRFGQLFFCARDECRVLHKKLRRYAEYVAASTGDEDVVERVADAAGGGDGGEDSDDIPDFLKDLERMEQEDATRGDGGGMYAVYGEHGTVRVVVDVGSDDDDETPIAA